MCLLSVVLIFKSLFETKMGKLPENYLKRLLQSWANSTRKLCVFITKIMKTKKVEVTKAKKTADRPYKYKIDQIDIFSNIQSLNKLFVPR